MSEAQRHAVATKADRQAKLSGPTGDVRSLRVVQGFDAQRVADGQDSDVAKFAVEVDDLDAAAPIPLSRRRAVLLLHGLCSSALEVRLFARTLRSHGYHVVTPTLCGYTAPGVDAGQRDVPPDFRRWIDDACAEFDRLVATGADVTICGVSLGATLALAVAAQRQATLRSLSLISTTLFYDGWNISRWNFLLPVAYYTPLGRLFHYREVPPYGVKNERVRTWIEGQLARGPLSSAGASTIPTASLREADRLIRHVKRSLPSVSTPTLMIHAIEDDVASLANVRYVQRHIASTVFSSVVVNDSYHMITLDNDRELAAFKTVQFFNAATGMVPGTDGSPSSPH
jgi:carboxylesterase